MKLYLNYNIEEELQMDICIQKYTSTKAKV